MSEYVVIYEQGADSCGAYCPDLPGLGVVGDTRAEAEGLIREGVDLHISSLREHGEAIPVATSTAGVVSVTVA
jgi:predicted RNase H-like HicB family nuclease